MSRNDRDVVIVSACRTPIGKFGGRFKDLRAYQLAGFAMEEAIRRAGIEKGQLDEVIAGDGLQCVDEANTARVAALGIGIPPEVPAFTVQRQCSSAMQALVSARQEIIAGDADVILAVGTESQSSAPVPAEDRSVGPAADARRDDRLVSGRSCSRAAASSARRC